jgi:hypothetical protein
LPAIQNRAKERFNARSVEPLNSAAAVRNLEREDKGRRVLLFEFFNFNIDRHILFRILVHFILQGFEKICFSCGRRIFGVPRGHSVSCLVDFAWD